jgi:hypothetical protein
MTQNIWVSPDGKKFESLPRQPFRRQELRADTVLETVRRDESYIFPERHRWEIIPPAEQTNRHDNRN